MKTPFRILLITAALALAIAGVVLMLQNDSIEQTLANQAGTAP